MILSVQQIRDKLSDRRLDVVSKATGLHVNTLHAIRSGKQTNVRSDTLVKLSDYFSKDCEVKNDI